MNDSDDHRAVGTAPPKLLYVVNDAHFFMSHRLAVAQHASSEGYEVHVAAPPQHTWGPEGFSEKELEDQGFAYHPIRLSPRGRNPFQELRTLLDLVVLYRRLKPAVVHHLTIKPVLYGGLASRLVGVSAVVHGITGLGQVFVASGLSAKVLRQGVIELYRLIGRHSTVRFIVQNRYDYEVLTEAAAIEPDKVTLIKGSGVALDRFVPTPEAADEPVVVLPARMIWEKGIGEFVAAGRQLKEAGLKARFFLVGATAPSNPRAVPEPQLRQWSAEGVVEWLGRREDMPQIMARANIVCLPSTYGEGVPKSLIEAAASGRAIVASDIPGCREIVTEDVNGLLVPPGDVPELAGALRRLIDDPAARRRMGEAGRKIAEDGFSEKSVVKDTLAAYRELRSADHSSAIPAGARLPGT